MRKFLILLTMVLLSQNINAQQLEGTYQASREFHTLMNSFVEEDNVDVDFSLFFNRNVINIIVTVHVSSEGMDIDCDLTIPGTYQRTGDRMLCKFNKKSTDFALTGIRSDDPEIQKVLNTDESREGLYKLLEEMMREEMESEMSDISEVSNVFQRFTIKSQTSRTITVILEDEMEITFIKQELLKQ